MQEMQAHFRIELLAEIYSSFKDNPDQKKKSTEILAELVFPNYVICFK